MEFRDILPPMRWSRWWQGSHGADKKYYSIFDIVRGRKVKPFSILNPTVSEGNLSLLTFSGEVWLPGGGEAGAGEDEEEESVHPPGCGGHGHYAACTNQLSTKLNNCMRPIMLSIANIITLSVSVQCPCPLYIFIFYACPFPLSYHILLPIPSFIECDVNYVPESQPSSSCPVPGWAGCLDPAAVRLVSCAGAGASH